ncbi:sigma-70 family RNA polymerase sigma factor [Pontibacillus yanchengensis]|uniref:RNA polymerase sigma-70 region 4 domain-containing protein n=1 Tax=Pontibacillus yanchengensis Y32 TaxID=1385514 RepID=A0A0A2T5H2_9BACI|nr:sigma-70 family RNA polymerase sigma factor [Pontibacillus yanchengensis]KGP71047.1 hypothetical protein N782_01695 [Pontibacillus yanchengensis Y32]
MYLLEEGVINDPLLKSFLKNENNLKLFRNYQENPTQENAIILDDSFKNFRTKIRAITYLSKAIHYKAIHYDQEIRKKQKNYLTNLDEPITEDNTMKDFITSETTSGYMTPKNLEESVQLLELKDAIKKLTSRESEILYMLIYVGYTEQEIAERFGVSQQSISKSKRKSLEKLRRELDESGSYC